MTTVYIKTIYISVRKHGIRALAIKERLEKRKWTKMWTGEGLICMMKNNLHIPIHVLYFK